MTTAVGATALVHLTETQVRTWSGESTFEQADTWHHAGHVSRPTIHADSIGADVLGTWRRVDSAVVTAVGKRIETHCTCNEGDYCRHATAVLLQWIREPQSFSQEASYSHRSSDSAPMVVVGADIVQPRDEILRLMESDTLTHLREIAHRRGLRPRGRNKPEVAAALATELVEPHNVDTAISGLSPDERAMLEAVDLFYGPQQGGIAPLAVAYYALGGEETCEVVLAELADTGLMFFEFHINQPASRFVVPRAVSERIPLKDSPLAHMLRSNNGAGDSPQLAPTTRLSPMEMCFALILEIWEGRIGTGIPELPATGTAAIASGWTALPADGKEASLYSKQHGVEIMLIPQPPLLSPADLSDMALRTGYREEAINFFLHILLAWGVIERVGRGKRSKLVAHMHHWYDIARRPPSAQASALRDAWYSFDHAFDFRGIVGSDKTLNLYTTRRILPSDPNTAGPRGATVRRTLDRVLERLAGDEESAGVSYDLETLLDTFWKLAPTLLETGPLDGPGWWFTASSEGDRRADIRARADWRLVWEPLIRDLLCGPATWLNLVKTDTTDDGHLLFRPVSRAGTPNQPRAAVDLGVNPKNGMPDIHVPAGFDGLEQHVSLANVTDAVTIAPDGFQYEITRTQAAAQFDGGGTDVELLAMLEKAAGVSIPDDVVEVIHGWWQQYGRIRLYDNLTFIELDDDILLQELQMTSSVKDAVVAVITPRLVAIQPDKAGALVAEMERLGHTPRVLDGL